MARRNMDSNGELEQSLGHEQPVVHEEYEIGGHTVPHDPVAAWDEAYWHGLMVGRAYEQAAWWWGLVVGFVAATALWALLS